MRWLKNLLKRKKVDEFEQEETAIEEVEEVPIQNNKKIRTCSFCELEIEPDEKWTKQSGNYMHRQCWKKAIKLSGMSV